MLARRELMSRTTRSRQVVPQWLVNILIAYVLYYQSPSSSLYDATHGKTSSAPSPSPSPSPSPTPLPTPTITKFPSPKDPSISPLTVPSSAPSPILSRSSSSKPSLVRFPVPFDIPSSTSRFPPSLDPIGLPSMEPRSGLIYVPSNIALIHHHSFILIALCNSKL